MGSKENLCLWCGRYTLSKAQDGFADCDRRDCIEKRTYDDEFDLAAGVKTVDDASD